MAHNNIEYDQFLSMKDRYDDMDKQISALDYSRICNQTLIARLTKERNALSEQVLGLEEINTLLCIAKEAVEEKIRTRDLEVADIVKYADDPNNDKFKSAVQKYRHLDKIVDSYQSVVDKLNSLQDQIGVISIKEEV